MQPYTSLDDKGARGSSCAIAECAKIQRMHFEHERTMRQPSPTMTQPNCSEQLPRQLLQQEGVGFDAISVVML